MPGRERETAAEPTAGRMRHTLVCAKLWCGRSDREKRRDAPCTDGSGAHGRPDAPYIGLCKTMMWQVQQRETTRRTAHRRPRSPRLAGCAIHWSVQNCDVAGPAGCASCLLLVVGLWLRWWAINHPFFLDFSTTTLPNAKIEQILEAIFGCYC
jgi:hypothetical protein